MVSQKKPFLYSLVRTGPNDQDILLKRIYGSSEGHSNIWGTHLDIGDPEPAKVLIFVNAMKSTGVDVPEIMHEINEAQTYWRKQIEPYPKDEI